MWLGCVYQFRPNQRRVFIFTIMESAYAVNLYRQIKIYDVAGGNKLKLESGHMVRAMPLPLDNL